MPTDPAAASAVLAAERAATLWRGTGQLISSGCAMLQASRLSWGDPAQSHAYRETASRDLRAAAAAAKSGDEKVGALCRLIAVLVDVIRQSPGGHEAKLEHRRVIAELADFLTADSEGSVDAPARLVKGIVLCTDLDGTWKRQYPARVEWGMEWHSEEGLAFVVPGAFELYLYLGDYAAAARLAEAHADAFDTPARRGWRDATRGFLATPDQAPNFFESALAHFAEDTCPPGGELPWTFINIDLWSKFFLALAALARITLEPKRAFALLHEAAGHLEGTDVGWANRKVSLLRAVLLAITEALDDPTGALPSRATSDLAWTFHFDPTDDESTVYANCVGQMRNAFELIRVDPGRALVDAPLRDALVHIGRTAHLGAEVARALETPLANAARTAMQGSIRTQAYRVLEGITDERVLHRILLRLFQAGAPRYAQIRHGPVEYGKDIAVVNVTDGRTVLRCYQAKIGPISGTNWEKVRTQIEAIFLVDIDTLQLGGPIDSREAIVVCNGHLTPYYDGFIGAWCREQLRARGWTIAFMHIDGLVNWIVDSQLLNELRAACKELGVAWPDAEA